MKASRGNWKQAVSPTARDKERERLRSLYPTVREPEPVVDMEPLTDDQVDRYLRTVMREVDDAIRSRARAER